MQEFLRSKQAGKPYDEAAYEKCLTASVAEVVREQAQAGIDVVSDGEFGKSISWSQYALERLTRLRAPADQAGHRQPIQARRRPHQFAEFYAELDAKRGGRDDDRSDLRRADQLYRTGRAAARHRQLQGGVEGREGRRRRSCRWPRRQA